MKTIKDITKKAGKSLALFLAIVFLISFTTNAQKVMKSVNFFPISYNSIMEKESLISNIISFSSKDEVLEKDIEFEEWMTDLNTWAAKADSGAYEASKEEESYDQEMDFEKWMFQKDWINKEETPKEEPQKLEAWMYTLKTWDLTSC